MITSHYLMPVHTDEEYQLICFITDHHDEFISWMSNRHLSKFKTLAEEFKLDHHVKLSIEQHRDAFEKMASGAQFAHRVYTCPQCGVIDARDDCIMCPKCNTPLTYIYERDDYHV